MSCDKCHQESLHCKCNKGSLHFVKGKDVFVGGCYLPFTHITPNDNLPDALHKIDCFLGGLPSVSANEYEGVPGEITINNGFIGIDPAYTLAAANALSNLEGVVVANQNCLSNAITEVAQTPGITVNIIPTTSGCGKRLILTVNPTADTYTPIVYQSLTNTLVAIANNYSISLNPSLPANITSGSLLSIKGAISRSITKLGTQSLSLTDGANTIDFGVVVDNSLYGSTKKILNFEIDLVVSNITPTTFQAKGVCSNEVSYDSGTGNVFTLDSTTKSIISPITFNRSSFQLVLANTDNPDIDYFTIELKQHA
jgi:hypothetical protein